MSALDPGRSSRVLPEEGRGAVVTVGTFDGVHRGHQAVLQEIERRARLGNRRSVLVTFDPHPLRIVRPEAAPPLLTGPLEKKALLAQSGLDYAVFLAFTTELQRTPARRFVEQILLDGLGMEELVIGYDHGFGRGREGSVETMIELGREFGFSVDVVHEVRVEGEPISSSRIRHALSAGDVRDAARALGRCYAVQGPVIEGERKGRELGFPTANLRIENPEKLLPAPGIYAVYGWIDGVRRPGLLHLGPRPTFAGFEPSVELHLLDWEGDLYGRTLQVDFLERIRAIERFDSVEGLVARMHEDAERGREIFARIEAPQGERAG